MAKYSWPEKPTLLGSAVTRLDGPDKVTGRARYTYDINRPGMIYGRMVRSPFAHARVVSIDLSIPRHTAALRSRFARPGQRLPGLRELAEATGVNANTVRAVYQRLEQDGLITSLQGSGTFVRAVPLEETCKSAFREEIERLCMSCLTQAARYGYTSEEVVNLLRKYAKRGDST